MVFTTVETEGSAAVGDFWIHFRIQKSTNKAPYHPGRVVRITQGMGRGPLKPK